MRRIPYWLCHTVLCPCQGDQDCLVGNEDGRTVDAVVYFENIGNSRFAVPVDHPINQLTPPATCGTLLRVIPSDSWVPSSARLCSNCTPAAAILWTASQCSTTPGLGAVNVASSFFFCKHPTLYVWMRRTGDMDGDGDYDCFVSNLAGSVYYFLNTGSPSAPAFTEKTGNDNPVSPCADTSPALYSMRCLLWAL